MALVQYISALNIHKALSIDSRTSLVLKQSQRTVFSVIQCAPNVKMAFYLSRASFSSFCVLLLLIMIYLTPEHTAAHSDTFQLISTKFPLTNFSKVRRCCITSWKQFGRNLALGRLHLYPSTHDQVPTDKCFWQVLLCSCVRAEVDSFALRSFLVVQEKRDGTSTCVWIVRKNVTRMRRTVLRISVPAASVLEKARKGWLDTSLLFQ